MAPLIVSSEDLHAFIDGELDDGRAREIAVLIAADPALADKVRAYRIDKARLLEHYEPLLARPLPKEWTERIANRAAGRMAAWRPFMALAASIVLLVAGWATYQFVVRGYDDAAVEQALAARDKPGGEIIAADAAKVSAALGMSLKLPNLTKAGYSLAGVTVYAEHRSKAVKIDYRNAENEVFTLYLTPSSGREAFDIFKRGDLRVCLWQDDVLATVMVGRMSAGEMLRVASLAYDGLYF